jgi:RNA polymerase sigma-70 factor (ECF subfamily)
VKGFSQGEKTMFTREHFTYLADKYMDMIFRLAYSQLKNKADADDVTQNVLLSLYKTETDFESCEHMKAWLCRVTMNECRKIWRSAWRRTEDIDDYANTLTFEDGQSYDLFQAIMALDGKYRSVIVLYYYEGYSISEIAEILDIPAGTVGTRLSRARDKLKNILTEAYCHD